MRYILNEFHAGAQRTEVLALAAALKVMYAQPHVPAKSARLDAHTLVRFSSQLWRQLDPSEVVTDPDRRLIHCGAKKSCTSVRKELSLYTTRTHKSALASSGPFLSGLSEVRNIAPRHST